MGKRSKFERIERDFYPTPLSAVVPLIPHLPNDLWYWEPCAGNGALADTLYALHSGTSGAVVSDIDPQPWTEPIFKHDALEPPPLVTGICDYIITNPPWTRSILHLMIVHFSDMLPTWLLFDADWVHTRQSAPYMNRLRKIVSVGRVKWIPDSPHTGKDNCAWHLFDKPSDEPAQFYGRSV